MAHESSPISLRRASAADTEVLAQQRVAMFRDMRRIAPSQEAELIRTSLLYFQSALASGEYVGWLLYAAASQSPLGGAGVQLRSLLPRPDASGQRILLGREGLVLVVGLRTDE